MRLSLRLSVFDCAFVLVLGLGGAAPSAAVTRDLAILLSNSGYESGGGSTTNWTATMPNSSYMTPVPVDPTIQPLDPNFSNGTLLPALTAPVGSHFVGVPTDPDTVDEKGKLVHDALSVSFAAVDTYQVTVWVNRGRLNTNGNTNSTFGASPPDMLVTLYGWGAGSNPNPVNSATDNWGRSPTYSNAQTFTNFGTPGQWTSQTFTWTPNTAFSFISLGIA